MSSHTKSSVSFALTLGALGVVYGDIGTSPLYAFKESLAGEHGIGVTPDNVLGILSLIFWAITLVVSLKYVALVLRADNQGEGGILSLLALVLRRLPAASRLRGPAIVCGLIGASMFYGDSVITPAISVLSAVEGLGIVSPTLEHYVVPLTLGILLGLFVVQYKGTASVGNVFGPIMLIWFATLGMLGLWQIAGDPAVLRAVSPLYAIDLTIRHPGLTLVILGAVFLALTGGEALYADMGHFGRAPIRLAWFGLVMPCLLLNYFGQGSLVLADPEAARNPFFLLVPDELTLPLVVLATAATVIASQAVISGAFSITSEAIKLGYLPRVQVDFTSNTQAGQIYVPVVNWMLLAVVMALVIGFGSSSALAAAYGIAVASTMVITTAGVAIVARYEWKWSPSVIALIFIPLALVDLLFLSANSVKIIHGGWFPLVFGAFLYFVFATWKRGRILLKRELDRGGISLVPFMKSLATYPPQRVEGTAVFMTASADKLPYSLLHNLKHNRVLHERVVFLTAVPETVPHVPPEQMAQVEDLGDGCWHITIHLGFRDSYDIAKIARLLSQRELFELEIAETSFFLSRATVIAGKPGGMRPWRQRFFAWMMRNAQPASDFFRMPPNRVIEIGTQVML
ncbi:MAG: potassium transporter Kup [Burkholderiaceae bacterium]